MYSHLFKSLKKNSVSSQYELWCYQYILARVTNYLKRSPGLQYHKCWNFSQFLCKKLAWQALCLAWKEGLQGSQCCFPQAEMNNLLGVTSKCQAASGKIKKIEDRIVTSICVEHIYMHVLQAKGFVPRP